MIGGEEVAVKRLDPILAALAPGTAEQGYLHCGPHGAGHFVKMVHNGIEYGIMAAHAEGLGVLHAANVGKQNRPASRVLRKSAQGAGTSDRGI
jgi:6-phosphogluconate dehydrogenase